MVRSTSGPFERLCHRSIAIAHGTVSQVVDDMLGAAPAVSIDDECRSVCLNINNLRIYLCRLLRFHAELKVFKGQFFHAEKSSLQERF